MDNNNLYKNKEKRLNERFEEQNMEDIFSKQIRSAVDMDKIKGI